MLKSMTAFGRAKSQGGGCSFCVEIRSLNRRHLDINVSLPSFLSHYEMVIHEWIKAAIERGAVSVRVEASFESDAPVSVVPNISLAREFKKAWELLQRELDFSEEKFAPLLISRTDLFSFQNKEDFTGGELFKQTILDALNDLEAAKICEGARLQNDLETRLVRLEEAISKMDELVPEMAPAYRAKLEKRIETFVTEQDEERLLREICLFAEKVDISEEMTRFRCHLDQFGQLMREAQAISGKKLEFITQELSREANTIAAKSQHIRISQAAIEVKCELERIREQLQNIE